MDYSSKLVIRDQTDDTNGQQLYRLLKVHDVPEFVKDASSDNIYAVDSLPSHVFADPIRHKFPCHTAAATWVSAAFFNDNKSEMPEKLSGWIESRLKAAASRFDIETHTYRIQEKAAEFKNDCDELTDDCFALVVKGADGSKERHYRIINAKEAQAAADFLYRRRDEIPFQYKHKMAEKIMELGNRYGADLEKKYGEFLMKQAGYGTCAPEDIAKFLDDRSKVASKSNWPSEIQTELAKMAETCRKKPLEVQDREALIKLATIVDQIDRAIGLNKEYSETLPRPEDVFFTVTRKAAAKILEEHCSMTSGSIYKVSEFSKLSLDDVKDALGSDLANAISDGEILISPSKLAELAHTLPRPDAEVFDRLCESAGISPVYKEAAHQAYGLGKDAWRKLAQHRVLAT